MSSTSRPISSSQFALAIQDLPIENLYSKAQELENSVTHLRRSNAQLQAYSDSIKNDTTLSGETREEVGDRECLEAIKENGEVIGRQEERIELLKAEVERRGQNWHGSRGVNGEASAVNGTGTSVEAQRTTGGTLSDEELRRRMEERMGGDETGEEGGDGMHL